MKIKWVKCERNAKTYTTYNKNQMEKKKSWERNLKTHPFSVRSASDDTSLLFISFLLSSGLAIIRVCAVLQAVEIASSLIPSSLGLLERRLVSSGSTCFAESGGRGNMKENMKPTIVNTSALKKKQETNRQSDLTHAALHTARGWARHVAQQGDGCLLQVRVGRTQKWRQVGQGTQFLSHDLADGTGALCEFRKTVEAA